MKLFFSARRPTKKERAWIKGTCPGSGKYMSRSFAGRYFLVARDAVFVMQPPETVVTVLRLRAAAGAAKEGNG